jgi:hypothetical protein
MRMFYGLIVLIWSLFVSEVIAETRHAECSAHSNDHIVPLIELYTSEGCSSCPPADRWLSGLQEQGFSSDKLIPLAFHVDYWDYIGWKDPFASPKFSARQRTAVQTGRAPFAYTPQILVNGLDFQAWRDSAGFAQTILARQNRTAQAKLTLNLKFLDSGEISVASTERMTDSILNNAEVYFAVYENNLVSSVDKGENSGRKLTHNHVVREFYGPYPLSALDSGEQHRFNLDAQWRQRQIGIVSFVQDHLTGHILQALALPLCMEQ